MRKDLLRLERSIRLTHPAVGRTVSDSTLISLRKAIEPQLRFEATTLDYARLVYPLIDTVACGHIGLYPRGALWRHAYLSNRHALPLSLKQLSDKKIVISALEPAQDSVLLGAQVLSVNKQPIDELVDEVVLFSGGSDGPNRSGARNHAVEKLPQHLRWTLGKQDSFQVLLRIANRDTIVNLLTSSARGKGLSAAKSTIKKKPNKAQKSVNYGFDANRKVAVVDLNSFSGYDPFNVIYPMVLKRVLAKAEKDSARAMILDLRGNGGGHSANVLNVLRFFIEEKTEVFGKWTLPKSGWQRASAVNKAIFTVPVLTGKGKKGRFGRFMRHRISPRKSGYSGKLLVLIDSGTFSAATITASVLKSSGRAKLMGQEAGGNYHETYAGLFSMIGMRRTGFVVRMPHLLIPVVVDESKQPFGKTLQPDIEVPITIEDVLDPRDRLLLRALEFSNN